MFQLEGGIELLTPRWEPAILTTRPEVITLNVKDFRNLNKYYQTKIENFFWHHARYYRHSKIQVINVNDILHDAKKIFKYSIVLIYILVKSLTLYQSLCGLMVSMSGFHPVNPGSNPLSASKLFSFLFFFPGLSQNFTKNQS